jgi:hypothetical protein
VSKKRSRIPPYAKLALRPRRRAAPQCTRCTCTQEEEERKLKTKAKIPRWAKKKHKAEESRGGKEAPRRVTGHCEQRRPRSARQERRGSRSGCRGPAFPAFSLVALLARASIVATTIVPVSLQIWTPRPTGGVRLWPCRARSVAARDRIGRFVHACRFEEHFAVGGRKAARGFVRRWCGRRWRRRCPGRK